MIVDSRRVGDALLVALRARGVQVSNEVYATAYTSAMAALDEGHPVLSSPSPIFDEDDDTASLRDLDRTPARSGA